MSFFDNYGELRTTRQILRNKIQKYELYQEKERALEEQPHQYPCSAAPCTTFVEDVSLLCPGYRCNSVKYCSRQCQSDDWGLHYNLCTEISAEEREVNLRALINRESVTDIIMYDDMEGCLVEQPGRKRFTNIQIGMEVSSTTYTAAYFKNSVKSHFNPSIQNVIRLHNIPDATFDVVQAEVYVTNCSYSQAVQCFPKNDVEGEIFMTNRVHRMKLANTIARKIWCQV